MAVFSSHIMFPLVFLVLLQVACPLPLPPPRFSRQQGEVPLIVGSLFQLFQPSAESACPNNVTHKVIRESGNASIQAVINFDNIEVNAMPCRYDSSNDTLYVVSYNYASKNLNVGNPLNLSSTATDAISIVGVDNDNRQCGTYRTTNPEMYYFTKDINSIWKELDETLIPDYSSISESSISGQSLWMISLRSDLTASQRVCIFKSATFVDTGNAQGGGDDPEESSTGDEDESESDGTSDDAADGGTNDDGTDSDGAGDEGGDDDETGDNDTEGDASESSGPDEIETTPSSENESGADESTGNQTGSPTDSGSPDESGGNNDPPSGNNTFPEAAEDARRKGAEPETSTCFPGDAVVRLSNGGTKRMDELELQDEVETGVNSFSRILTFTHRQANTLHEFIVLRTRRGKELVATPSHIIYFGNGRMAAMRQARVGDSVIGDDGKSDEIVQLRRATKKGLFNPQTVDGDIVVNGVKASTYTEALHPNTAHSVLLPLRVVLRYVGWAWQGLDSGAPAVIARLLRPESVAVCEDVMMKK